MSRLELIGLKLPEVKPGDNLAKLIAEAASSQAGGLRDGDVVVVAAKVVSKALGLLYKPGKPSLRVNLLARMTGKPVGLVDAIIASGADVRAVVPLPKKLKEFIAREYARDPQVAMQILKRDKSILVTRTAWGLASDGGVDASNVEPGYYALPPRDPDQVAKELREELRRLTGRDVAVVITDTEVWLRGSIDIAIGCSGITPVHRGFGSPDLYGRPKYGGVDSVVDEVAAAAALLMKQCSEGIPVVIVRGLEYEKSEKGCSVIATPIPAVMIMYALLATLVYRLLKLLRLVA